MDDARHELARIYEIAMCPEKLTIPVESGVESIRITLSLLLIPQNLQLTRRDSEQMIRC